MKQDDKDLLSILTEIYESKNGVDFDKLKIKVNERNSIILITHNLVNMAGNTYTITNEGIREMFELKIEEINANRLDSETIFHQRIELTLAIAAVATISYYFADTVMKGCHQTLLFLGSAILLSIGILLFLKKKQ